MRRRLVRPGQVLVALVPVLTALAALTALTGCGSSSAGEWGTATPTQQAGPSGQAGRSGPAGRGGQLRIVALGDSVTAGTACDCKAFVQLYAGMVAARTGADVTWTNDGVGGQTSSGLVSELRSRATAADVRAADVVVVTIGANDLGAALDAWQHGACATSCMRAALPAISANIAQIVARVRQLQDRPGRSIAVTDYWNVFEDGQVADRDYGNGFASWSDRVTRLANAAICSAARQADAICVDLYAPFNGSGDRDPTPLLAADGDHPDAQGHEAIAEALAAAVMPVGADPVGDH